MSQTQVRVFINKTIYFMTVVALCLHYIKLSPNYSEEVT